jgi:hypothetical protein
MFSINSGCKWDCLGLSIVASIIVGIITAFLVFSATITLTPAFLWVTLGIAVVYLAVAFLALALSRNIGYKSCVCPILSVLLTGILGTVLLSLVLLGVTFAATSVLGAVINITIQNLIFCAYSQSMEYLVYLPYLALIGVLGGTITGFAVYLSIKRLPEKLIFDK